MNIILKTSLITRFIPGIMVAMLLLASCGQKTELEAAATEQQRMAPVAADTASKRPAPAFFVVPPEMVRQRVWICEDASSDIFHVKNDCPLLLACRGKGNFRNVSLPRAIEAYGRYNCQTCSKDLDAIFDEDMVREVYTR